jgi:hypothetical protein
MNSSKKREAMGERRPITRVCLLASRFSLLAACFGSPLSAQGFVQHVTGIPVTDRTGAPITSPFLGGFNLPRPQLVDIDGDGDLDLFVQETRHQVKFFERVGSEWIWRTDRWQDVEVGEWYRFADLDGDGDLDLLGEMPLGYIRAWRNEGSRTAARMVAVPDSLRDITGKPIFADPQNILNVVDIDCNGRPDLFLGRVAGHVDRFEQEASDTRGMPIFRLLAERWQDIEVLGPIPGDTMAFDGRPTRHGANTMAFGDVDGDGDLDLFWGDFFEAGVLLIRNEGTCRSPYFGSAHEQFPRAERIVTTGYNAPATGDVDGDGRLDLVLGVIGGAYQPNHSAIDNLYLVLQREPGQFTVTSRRLISMIDVVPRACRRWPTSMVMAISTCCSPTRSIPAMTPPAPSRPSRTPAPPRRRRSPSAIRCHCAVRSTGPLPWSTSTAMACWTWWPAPGTTGCNGGATRAPGPCRIGSGPTAR